MVEDEAAVAGLADGIEAFADSEIALGDGADFGDGLGQRHHVGLAVEHDAGGGQRHFEAGQVIGAEEGVVGAGADVKVVHALDDARVLGLDDDEDAGGDALADGEIDDALLIEDAAIGLGDQHLDHLVAVGLGAVHAGHVRHEAGGVGDAAHLDHGLRAIDELDQHARVHVPADGFLAIVVGDGIVVERVVLALAGRDDAVAEGGGELDQLHAGAGLVAGADGIDDAEAVGLALEVGADGDVGLDVHHHQMLAVLHRHQVEIGGDAGLAGGVDDDVDERVGHHGLDRGDGAFAGLDGGGDFGRGVGLDAVAVLAIGDGHGLARGMRAAGGDGGDLDAAHQHALGDEVGAHFARADDADADRLACRRRGGRDRGRSRSDGHWSGKRLSAWRGDSTEAGGGEPEKAGRWRPVGPAGRG